MSERPNVSISPNPIRTKEMMDAHGNTVDMKNKGIKQAQEELRTKPIKKDE